MELKQYPKVHTPVQQYKGLFTEIVASEYSTWEHTHTDRSKSVEGVGSVVVWRKAVREKALPQQASIYTTEVSAIKLGLSIVGENKLRRVVFLSDSCREVTRLENVQFDDQLMDQIYANNRTGHQAQSCWIPRHCNISGNEITDLAVKQAAKRDPTMHPLPFTKFYPVISKKMKGQ